MARNPLDDILQEPVVKEINECMDQAGSSQDANASFGRRANPTELTGAHLDELVALARRRKNPDRIFWVADDESPSLCDGEDHQVVFE